MSDVPGDVTAGVAWRRGVGFFVASRTLSVIGDMAAITALSVFIFRSSGSATMVSGLFVVRVLPRLFGPLAGALADRYDLRRLLVLCDLAAFVLFGAVALIQPGYWPLLALILIAESVATVAQPGARTWVARRVPPEPRARLNGVLMAGIAIGFGVGAGIGGATATAFGYRWAMLLNALSFLLSAALIYAARSVPPIATRSTDPPSLLSSALAGIRALVADRRLRGVAVGLIGVGLAAAIDRPAVVALTQDDLHARGGGYGLLLAMINLGAFAMSFMVGRDYESDGCTEWACCGDPWQAREYLEAVMLAMSRRRARELRSLVEALDRRY